MCHPVELAGILDHGVCEVMLTVCEVMLMVWGVMLTVRAAVG